MKYELEAYYDGKLRGLAESIETDDITEAQEWVWEHCQHYIVFVKNLEKGRCKIYANPDKIYPDVPELP